MYATILILALLAAPTILAVLFVTAGLCALAARFALPPVVRAVWGVVTLQVRLVWRVISWVPHAFEVYRRWRLERTIDRAMKEMANGDGTVGVCS